MVTGALLFKKEKLLGHTYAVHHPDDVSYFSIMIIGGPTERNRTLVKLKATRQELNVKMIRDDSEEVDKYTFKRN